MDFARIQQLFGEARALSSREARAAYVKGQGDDEALQEQVLALLAHHDEADTQPAPDLASPLRASLESALDAPDAGGGLPTRIGPYEIVDRLGAGGMATVFRARQAEPARDVALKVLHLSAGGEGAAARFRLEAEVLARLQHEGIAQVYDAGVAQTPDGSRAYLVMELVEGQHLTDFDRSHDLDLDARLDLLLQILDATAHAHRQGIIHRDIKPSNVLVTERGRSKLLDFGVARIVGDDSGHTATGDVIGTLRYMSPEQARGDVHAVDTRADVYAVGVMAYELFAGRHPLHDVDGNAAAVISALLSREASPVRDLAPSLPADVATIIHKAMDRDPARRYSGADAFAADLRRFLGGQPIEARDPTLAYQFRRFVGRHRALVSGAAIAVLALLVSVVLALGYARNAHEERQRADAQTERVEAGATVLRIQAADAAWKEDRLVTAAQHLHEVPRERRGWVWGYVHARCDNTIASMRRAPAQGTIRVTPEGDLRAPSTGTASDAGPGPLRITHGPAGNRHAKLPGLQKPLELPWDLLNHVRLRYERVRVYFADGRVSAELGNRRASAITLMPESEEVLVGTHDRAIVAWHPASGRERELALEIRSTPQFLAYDAPRGRLAVAVGHGVVQLFSLATGDLLETLRCRGDVQRLAFVNDGRHIVGVSDTALQLWEPGAERHFTRMPLSTKGRRAFVYGLSIRADGQRVAAASWAGQIEHYDLVALESRGELPGVGGRCRAVAFTPQGDELVLRERTAITRRAAGSGALLGEAAGARGAEDLALAAPAGLAASLRLGRGVAELCVLPLATGPGRRVGLPLAPGEGDSAVRSPRWAPLVFDGAATRVLRRSAQGWALHGWPGRGLLAHGATEAEIGILTRLRMRADGAEFVGATATGVITVRALDSGAERLRLLGHEGAVYGLALHPSEALLASGGDDGTIRLWSLQTGEALLTIAAHDEYVHDLAFTPDGATLVSGGGDGALRIWATAPLAERRADALEARAR